MAEKGLKKEGFNFSCDGAPDVNKSKGKCAT